MRLAGDVEYVCEARRTARLIERTGTPVFLYSFEYEVDPVVVDRVAHGMDVNFVFGNNFLPPLFPSYVLNDTDLALSRQMSRYWARFAAAGKSKHRRSRRRPLAGVQTSNRPRTRIGQISNLRLADPRG